MAAFAASAALGLALGLSAVAATALLTAAAARRIGGVGGVIAAGAGLRLLGAIAGVTAGVLLRPRSIPWFVAAFLVSYLAGQAVVVLRTGYARSRG